VGAWCWWVSNGRSDWQSACSIGASVALATRSCSASAGIIAYPDQSVSRHVCVCGGATNRTEGDASDRVRIGQVGHAAHELLELRLDHLGGRRQAAVLGSPVIVVFVVPAVAGSRGGGQAQPERLHERKLAHTEIEQPHPMWLI
jgi:hypothetical protein